MTKTMKRAAALACGISFASAAVGPSSAAPTLPPVHVPTESIVVIVGTKQSVVVNQNAQYNVAGVAQLGTHLSSSVTQNGQYNNATVLQFTNPLTLLGH